MQKPHGTPWGFCYTSCMQYLWHFLKFLGVFALIVGLSLFGMQFVGGAL